LAKIHALRAFLRMVARGGLDAAESGGAVDGAEAGAAGAEAPERGGVRALRDSYRSTLERAPVEVVFPRDARIDEVAE
jgi:hypothetical protein